MLLEKAADDSTWQTLYEGIYALEPEIELIVIAEKQDLDGFGFKTLEVRDTTYTAREDSRQITFERCGDRY